MTIMNEQQKVPDWLVVDAGVAEVHPFVPHRLEPVFATITGVTEYEVTLSNEVVYPVPGLRRTQGEDTFVLMSVPDPQVLRVRLAHAVWEQRAAVVEKYEVWLAEPTELNTRALENAARNILTEGLRLLAASSIDAPEQPLPLADGRSESINACGAEVRPPETVAPSDEPGRPGKVLQRC